MATNMRPRPEPRQPGRAPPRRQGQMHTTLNEARPVGAAGVSMIVWGLGDLGMSRKPRPQPAGTASRTSWEPKVLFTVVVLPTAATSGDPSTYTVSDDDGEPMPSTR